MFRADFGDIVGFLIILIFIINGIRALTKGTSNNQKQKKKRARSLKTTAKSELFSSPSSQETSPKDSYQSLKDILQKPSAPTKPQPTPEPTYSEMTTTPPPPEKTYEYVPDEEKVIPDEEKTVIPERPKPERGLPTTFQSTYRKESDEPITLKKKPREKLVIRFNRKNLKKAFILHEILGPCVAKRK
jgi:FtsZ-interacting cell division protein ZipA